MDEYKLDLGLPYNEINIRIEHKEIKNIHLKVFRDFKVVISVPKQAPDEIIIEILKSKTEWITKQLLKYKQSSGHNNLTNIKSGSSSQLLGKDRRIKIIFSLKNSIEEEEKNIIIYTKNIDDESAQEMLSVWWRNKAKKIFTSEIDILYNKIFKKYDILKPSLHIRKMKTLWGSCNPSKNKITINEYLLKADILCIQYVILHELTHLIHPYHNSNFYNFLTVQMPDWKKRKEELDKEVVQGLEC